jgi:hypothetical protein
MRVSLTSDGGSWVTGEAITVCECANSVVSRAEAAAYRWCLKVRCRRELGKAARRRSAKGLKMRLFIRLSDARSNLYPRKAVVAIRHWVSY